VSSARVRVTRAYESLAARPSGTPRGADDQGGTPGEHRRTRNEIMNITQAPHGINVVVETEDAVYIGRLGKLEGEQVKMHHAAVFQVAVGESPEEIIRHTARFGVPVEHADLMFETRGIKRVRKLGDVPKA
jgi:hypothetical protein